jgi:hypothetical protein
MDGMTVKEEMSVEEMHRRMEVDEAQRAVTYPKTKEKLLAQFLAATARLRCTGGAGRERGDRFCEADV